MPTNFPTGVNVFGMPVMPGGVPPSTGKVFFVSNRSGDSGSNGNDGLSSERPFSTLATAVALCSSGRGDVIIVMPGHAETVTTTITPIAGSAIIGLGWGRNKPSFTGSGAIGVFTLSAANVFMRNIRVVGASASVTAHIILTGDDFICEDCEFTHNATPLLSIDVNSTGDRFVFRRCKWVGAAAGPDRCIDLARDSGNNFLIEDCTAQYSVGSTDLDLAFIGGPAADRPGAGGIIDGLTVVGLAAAGAVVDFNSSTAETEGVVANVKWATVADATIANTIDLGGYGAIECYAVETGGERGVRLPAATGD